MKSKIKFVVPLIMFFLVCQTGAGTYYVSASRGNDANPGSEEKPFRTIQKAADVMVAGDDCLIDDGVYRETVTLKKSGTKEKPIRFDLNDVTLEELIKVLHELTTGETPLDVSTLFLKVPRGAEKEERWSAEATLTYLIYSPMRTD